MNYDGAIRRSNVWYKVAGGIAMWIIAEDAVRRRIDTTME
jgi:hypothetical protein